MMNSRSDIISDLNKLPRIKNTLIEIGNILNSNNIKWALGGSLLLYLNGINTTVADIDILVDERDTLKLLKLVNGFKHIEKPKTDIYLTERFFSITLKGVDIDLMVGFKVKTDNEIYSFPVGNRLINKEITVDSIKIYLSSVEDWFNAYLAMDRKDKVKMILESNILD